MKTRNIIKVLLTLILGISQPNLHAQDNPITAQSPRIYATSYDEGLKTITGNISVTDKDLVIDDLLTKVNYTIRLGKVKWIKNGEVHSAWIVDSAEVTPMGTASEFKSAPKIEVVPRLISGRLVTYIYVSLQIAGPKVTTQVGFTASAGISRETGLKIGNDIATANAGISGSLGVSFSCGRTAELPGAEIGLRRGIIVENKTNGSARIYRNTDEDVDPEDVNIKGGGGIFDGDADLVVKESGRLFKKNRLSAE